jgi:mono/diheme cytochrome c family protein
MKKYFIRFGKVLGILLALVLVFYAWVEISFYRKAHASYNFPISPGVRVDSSLIERGAHLVQIKGCTDCHGGDLSGRIIEDNFPVGLLVAPNLTPSESGLAHYTLKNWVMALQHGIDPTGRPLKVMPSFETSRLTLEDMSAIISYVKSVPPVENNLPETRLGPVIKVMTKLSDIPMFSVDLIDHEKPLESKPEFENSVELGKYLSVPCTSCHRPDLKGGEAFVPGGLPAPSIASDGRVGTWSVDEFIKTLKTGVRPDGHKLDSTQMPWPMTAKYTEEELSAMYQYFRSVK